MFIFPLQTFSSLILILLQRLICPTEQFVWESVKSFLIQLIRIFEYYNKIQFYKFTSINIKYVQFKNICICRMKIE